MRFQNTGLFLQSLPTGSSPVMNTPGSHGFLVYLVPASELVPKTITVTYYELQLH
jgi:hypothetical protein